MKILHLDDVYYAHGQLIGVGCDPEDKKSTLSIAIGPHGCIVIDQSQAENLIGDLTYSLECIRGADGNRSEKEKDQDEDKKQ